MSVYRYTFTDAATFGDALDTLVLARIAVASALGDARALLELDCTVDHGSRAVLIGASSKPGEMLSRVFMGFLAREFPTGAFKVSVVRPATPVTTCSGGASTG